MSAQENIHEPVMVPEVLTALEGEGEGLAGWVVDGTLGIGGHASAILDHFPDVRVFGVDQDPEVLAHARERLQGYGDRARVRRGRMSSLDELIEELGEQPIGVFFDLGANSLHFDSPERGFSFQADGPLDMRMDPDRTRSAFDIIKNWDEGDLADLFYYEGGERRSRAIAHAIVKARRRVPFQRTYALADLIASVLGGRGGEGRIHPATRTFQALRRAVNEEGEELLAGLQFAERCLREGGRLVVLSFHSGEDGTVKRFLVEGSKRGAWRTQTKKPVQPTRAEVRRNPRARSTRLRAAFRLREQGEAAS